MPSSSLCFRHFTAYPIHFVKNKISSAAKNTLFFAGKMALMSKYCRDKTNTPQNFWSKVNNFITVRFGKFEITKNPPKKTNPPRRMLNPKCPKRKKSLLTLNRYKKFYLLYISIIDTHHHMVTGGPAVYNGI